MAAAAILNLLFLSILVYFCPFWSNCLFPVAHFCKISFIYVNPQLRYCCLCKNYAAILDFIFVQYFGMRVCRTLNVIYVPNFVQIRAIMNKL